MHVTPRRILIATDFSATGIRAQDFALTLARSFGAELHVVHVQVLLDEPHLDDERQRELEELMAAADGANRKAMEAPAADTGVTAHAHLVRGLSAAEAIVETCGDLGCDVIVMGTHGRRGLTHMLLGSVAEKVVRTASVPVLTMRPDASLPQDGIRNIMIPHDFSEHSRDAVRIAAAWARSLEAKVTLFHAVEPVVYPEFYAIDLLPDEMIGRLRSRSAEALDNTAEELLQGLEVETVVRVGRAADAIVAEAESEVYDLVIMGTRGLSVIEHLLLGSVAESVIRRCPEPLLAVGGSG